MSDRARVMLVDDDASIRRFVEMTLETLDIELLACASVAQALAALRLRPVDLLITDLTMPGESGLVLLQRLHAEPALRGGARLAVFSAGLHGGNAAQLDGFDIWRLLPKPVSVAVLEDCVREALPWAPLTLPPTQAPDAGEALAPCEHRAIASHFTGDPALFVAFRDECRARFAADLHDGHAAVARGDMASLHHLAHSLKSVLVLLGHDPLAEIARTLESCAATGDTTRAPLLWATLADGLQRLHGVAAAAVGSPPPSTR